MHGPCTICCCIARESPIRRNGVNKNELFIMKFSIPYHRSKGEDSFYKNSVDAIGTMCEYINIF